MPSTGHRPCFEDAAKEYLASGELAGKKEGTRKLEGWAIGRWIGHLGGIRVYKITPALIHHYREGRLKLGRTARTVNLDTIALRNVLKFARERGWLQHLPETRQLRQPPPKRSLMTKDEFGRLLAAATSETTKNSALLRLYLHFLALTGAREKEALAVRWSDVDFERETVTIGSGGVAKNHRSRTVDFSGELGTLLQQMHTERPPGSSWLFPSPRRVDAASIKRELTNSLRQRRPTGRNGPACSRNG